MTFAGKILVMVNLALSLVLATWALGVYTSRTDWADKTKGEVARRDTQAKAMWTAVSTAEARWFRGGGTARRYEYYRGENTPWYAEQLKELDASNASVKAVQYKEGKIDPDPKQQVIDPRRPAELDLLIPARPVMSPAKDPSDKPLRSLKCYRQGLPDDDPSLAGMDRNQKEFAQMGFDLCSEKTRGFTAEYKKLFEEDARLTAELGGDEEADTVIETITDGKVDRKKVKVKELLTLGQGKSLRHRLELEQAKQDRIKAELETLEPLRVNSLVEADLLAKRRASLEARVKELEALGVTAAREP